MAASIAQRWLLTMFESWSGAGTKFFNKSALFSGCQTALRGVREAELGGRLTNAARKLHEIELWHWCAVVEKYDATALGVSGGGGEYSVQSGECVRRAAPGYVKREASVDVMFMLVSISSLHVHVRLRLDERCDALAAGPLRLEPVGIHAASWQRHNCSTHLGLTLAAGAQSQAQTRLHLCSLVTSRQHDITN